MAPGPEVEVAVDNDVLLKAACYGLAIRFWPQAGEVPGVGILGASRFVLAKATERGDRVRDQAGARRALDEFFALTAVLEPSGDELRVAAELERLAQRAGLALDIGESQLAAMLAGRDIAWLDTGDKRAVAALDGSSATRKRTPPSPGESAASSSSSCAYWTRRLLSSGRLRVPYARSPTSTRR